jgi:hypothetical protein
MKLSLPHIEFFIRKKGIDKVENTSILSFNTIFWTFIYRFVQ